MENGKWKMEKWAAEVDSLRRSTGLTEFFRIYRMVDTSDFWVQFD